MKYCLWVVILVTVGCSSNRYFIVRHAEKIIMTKDSADMMANNPPLSEAGKERAFVLRDELKGENIGYIFSTNTLRTISTVQPLNELKKNIQIQLYSPAKDSLLPFIHRLKAISKGNVLIAGHSNTVDDIVNALCGEVKIPGDLKDSEYDNMFIVKRKGKKMFFEQKKYGLSSSSGK